jgi:hypothetical protein
VSRQTFERIYRPREVLFHTFRNQQKRLVSGVENHSHRLVIGLGV